MSSPDRRDALDNQNHAYLGIDVGRAIKHSGAVLPPSARYLAIGPGQAHAEIALADTLGVSLSHMTLIDRNFSLTAHTRLKSLAFPGLMIEKDIFDFLQEPSEEKFDLVSFFSMEYVTGDLENLKKLLSGLSTKMAANGIVVMFPPCGSRSLWESYSFSPLEEGQRFNLYWRFNSPPREEK